MENVRKNLELIEVVYKNENKKCIMTFLDDEVGEVLEVNFNKQIYQDDDFVDDEEKAKKVDEWCKEYFDCEFLEIGNKIGVRKDVYKYEKFNSLWETQVTSKFSIEDEGTIFQTTIKRITDDGTGLHIYFDYEGKEYESKYMYSDYIENLKKWFVNPQKKNRQFKKFKDKFGVTLEESKEIINKEIMVEVKVAFKKHAYCDIKKPNWK